MAKSNHIDKLNKELAIVLCLFFIASQILLFASMYQEKDERSGFCAILEVFPLNLFWTPVGKGEIKDVSFTQARFENELGKKIREEDNLLSPAHYRYTLKCNFTWKDNASDNTHNGKCYSVSQKMTTNTEVVVWNGIYSTAKLKGTLYSPVRPSFLCAMLILPIVFLVSLIYVLVTIRRQRKQKERDIE
ncbi:MAG: hypothetical protein IJQ39_02640 [Thermoguttaceae bacterium]|nr:hypothetical protein [Thermoguttaceae bacterium]